MRSWIMALLATGALAACQTDGVPPSDTSHDLTGATCQAQMPKTYAWDGSAPPAAGPTQMYLVFAPENGYSLAALVDHGTAQVPYATYVPAGKRTTFLTLADKAGRIVTGGNPPPPPDVIPPDKLAAFLVASAIRYADVPAQAAGDVAACK